VPQSTVATHQKAQHSHIMVPQSAIAHPPSKKPSHIAVRKHQQNFEEDEGGLSEITIAANELDSLPQEISSADHVKAGKESLLDTRAGAENPADYLKNMRVQINQLEKIGLGGEKGTTKFGENIKMVKIHGEAADDASKQLQHLKLEVLNDSDSMNHHVKKLRNSAAKSVEALKKEMNEALDDKKISVADLPPDSNYDSEKS